MISKHYIQDQLSLTRITDFIQAAHKSLPRLHSTVVCVGGLVQCPGLSSVKPVTRQYPWVRFETLQRTSHWKVAFVKLGQCILFFIFFVVRILLVTAGEPCYI